MSGIPTGNLAGGPAGAGLPGPTARDPGPGTDAMTGIVHDDGNRVKAAEPAHSTIKSTTKLNAPPKVRWHQVDPHVQSGRQVQPPDSDKFMRLISINTPAGRGSSKKTPPWKLIAKNSYHVILQS